MKTLIFGLGNTILSDDGVGIRIARELKKLRIENSELRIKEGSIGGLSILDEIDGYDRLILIDSIETSKGKPGEVYKLKAEDFNTVTHLSSSHGLDFLTTLKLGKKFGYKIPKIIDIYAVEIKDNITFNEECTEEVEASIPRVMQEIKDCLVQN